ncbi:stage 0 sporulation protein [Candidatus Falkowbacteria bacterium]|nr:stage 0 sporulation protein [Candidatus Falkowbacteria bacterium]
MKAVLVKFAPWDKTHFYDPSELELAKGDFVIVDSDVGEELGAVVDVRDIAEDKLAEENEGASLEKILRKAEKPDMENMPTKKDKEEALKYCKRMIDKHDLEMKLVDVLFSLSGAKITFAFIADGRVDFRELVKELTSHFNKMIRLTQIGIRDEAKICGDCGHCGRPLCCRTFLDDFESITSEMAETQQVVHRGSDRISGVCGRLMCCLYYEQTGYKELAEKMPDIGQRVNVDGQRGTVVAAHVLKQTVDVEFEDKKDGRVVVEVDLNRHKK